MFWCDFRDSLITFMQYELAFVKAYELCKSGELGDLRSFNVDWNFYMAKGGTGRRPRVDEVIEAYIDAR